MYNVRHRSYCPSCRATYYSRNPGRNVVAYSRGGKRSYRGGVPSLKYLAARAVGRRNLFKYRAPKHSH